MRNAFLNRDWGLYLILLLATQPVPLSSQKVTLEAGVGKQDEGMSHTGYRCSGASLHLSACPAHLTEAHALSAPRGGTFHPNPAATRRPGPAPLTALPIPSGIQAEQSIWTKPPAHHSAAQDFWPTSFSPVRLPVGTDISKLHISSSRAIKCWPWPKQGAQWEKGQAPRHCSRGL